MLWYSFSYIAIGHHLKIKMSVVMMMAKIGKDYDDVDDDDDGNKMTSECVPLCGHLRCIVDETPGSHHAMVLSLILQLATIP